MEPPKKTDIRYIYAKSAAKYVTDFIYKEIWRKIQIDQIKKDGGILKHGITAT